MDQASSQQKEWTPTRLFTGSCTFVAGANNHAALPAMTLPEIAFAGRSNVGKSSLLNALTGRNSLARTSQTPGATRQLNFFNISDGILLVDMPGYGYAKASKSDIAKWIGTTKRYLCGRTTLRRVCVLVDARRGITPPDTEWMDMLDDTAVPYRVVLTKADKVSATELAKVQNETEQAIQKHPAAMVGLITTSSEKRTGIDELRADLFSLAELPPLYHPPHTV
jgi:GTP-binding protein